MSPKMALVQCHDRDGWEWTSRLRDFDLSLCAEEGFILTPLLAVLAAAALARIARLLDVPARVISRNGRWRLWSKLVRFVRVCALRVLTLLPDTSWSRVLDQSNHARVHSHRPDQHSRRSATPCTRASCTPPRPLLDPCQPSPNTVLLHHPLALLALLHRRARYLDAFLRASITRHATRSFEVGCRPFGVAFLCTRVHLS